MNLRRVSGLECFTIKGRKGNTYNVNLKTMTAEHTTVDNFRIKKQVIHKLGFSLLNSSY